MFQTSNIATVSTPPLLCDFSAALEAAETSELSKLHNVEYGPQLAHFTQWREELKDSEQKHVGSLKIDCDVLIGRLPTAQHPVIPQVHGLGPGQHY